MTLLTRPRFGRFAALVLGWNLAVVAWGAFVRATGSGAGCGAHWPLCNGQVVPRAPEVATLIEFTHRLTSGLALLAVLLLARWAFVAFPRGHRVRRAATASALFIVTEALLGAGLVLFELVAQDASVARAFAMAAHLVNTFLLIAALALTMWWGREGADAPLPGPAPAVALTALPFGAALAAVLATGVTGAIAALGDTLFPATSLAEGFRQDVSAGAHFLLRLRILHPAVAVVTAGLLAVVAVLAAARQRRGSVPRLALGLAVLAAVQVGAGIANLVLLAPVWLQLVHLLLADLVWIVLVLLAAESLLPAGAAGRVARAQPAPVPSPRPIATSRG